ncbi:hypothetical protein HNQ80_003232 [Anaerosolibacter carboniphilus]|uniref:Uncharacterized protein n=1 Tax=Anaerosolibacter carboniphilus TaxID=1417629 RepID=A0A841KU54_9FIRM|nr:hypothetical protein [Anaerosolibacter carboniphilus]
MNKIKTLIVGFMFFVLISGLTAGITNISKLLVQ